MIDIRNELYAYPVDDTLTDVLSNEYRTIFVREDDTYYYVSKGTGEEDNLWIFEKATGKSYQTASIVFWGDCENKTSLISPPYNLKIGKAA